MSSSIFRSVGSLCGTLPLVSAIYAKPARQSARDVRNFATLHRLNVEAASVERILLDEQAARLDLIAHQLGESLLRFFARRDLHFQHRARLRVHRGRP